MLSTGLPQGAVPKLERPGPLRERDYEALLELITTRALRPGRHLVESELAGHLGVSRQPVREALQRLNTDGWVDLRPAPGAFVHEPTEEEAAQLLTVAGNAVLAELAAQVGRRVRWYCTPVARQRGKQSWIEHRELIAAIADRDEPRATSVMRAHTEHTRRRYHDQERTQG
ncbi:GntR family transcriptional regulator [Streptomyces lydicus]|uniref:GntR family transcriptional regulator n=1 Tax=Streptomyces lydicus TaxID=47763 RepID=UPI0037A6DD35